MYKVFMAFTQTKKLYGVIFKVSIQITIRSQTCGLVSDQNGPDLTGSGSASQHTVRKGQGNSINTPM
jgi:hypothetical protein